MKQKLKLWLCRYVRPEVTDAPLTHKGRLQAQALQSRTRQLPVELVVVSPLCRATQTGLIAFAHLLDSGKTKR